MDVTELHRDQLIELKQHHLHFLEEQGKLLDVAGINKVTFRACTHADELLSDDIIFEEYSTTIFSNDDFFCSTDTE